MDSTEDTMQFAVGEHVVYPLQGVGVITRIEEQDFRGVDTMYYVIYLDISDMTVMIPVGKSKELGIRGIVAKGEAQKAIDSISSKYEPMPVDWKARYQMNVDLLKEGRSPQSQRSYRPSTTAARSGAPRPGAQALRQRPAPPHR